MVDASERRLFATEGGSGAFGGLAIVDRWAGYHLPILRHPLRLVSVTRRLESLQEITKEVAEIDILLTRSLFAGGIPHRLLLRVSLVKPTSAPLRF